MAVKKILRKTFVATFNWCKCFTYKQSGFIMKKINSILLLLTVIILSTATVQAQNAGIGLRATPDGGGFNAKIMMSKHLAFEGQLNAGGIYGLNGESFTAVALLEGVIPLPDNSWRLFFGGGVHAGVWDNGRWYNRRDDIFVTNRPQPLIGIDGIGGVEYIFKNIPLGLSADLKPAINFTGNGPTFFNHNLAGFTARYYFR